MRGIAFFTVVAMLLPIVLARPFVGVLLWSWISFMSPQRIAWGFASDLPWALIVFAATVVGCVLAREPRRLPVNAVTVLLVVLLAAFTVTSFAALAPPQGVWAKWDRTFKVVLGLLLTAALLTDRRRIHALIWVIVVSLGYWGVRGGVFTVLTGGNYRVWGPEETMISDNNHIAVALLVAMPLMNYLRQHSAHRIVRIGLVAAMALDLLAVLGSHSRGALIGLAAMTLILWLRSSHKLVSAAVLGAALAAGIAFMPANWTDRMNTISHYQEDASANSRLEIWGVSLKLAQARPLLGGGFLAPYTQAVVDGVAPGATARAVHSIWFEVLGEHGFAVFALWCGLYVAGLWYSLQLVRRARERPDLAWAADLGRAAQASIAAYLAGGSFLSLSYWDVAWTLLVALGAAAALTRHAPLAREAAAGWRGRRAALLPAPARP